ncbi:hypothetical protein CLAIMM_13805 [Cladophialophora immunda]|nr:hypothetical protein CLAIMM_13805 [Cladophialophora immunda]
MPFLADSHVVIPNKDILSWIFEHEETQPGRPIYVDAVRPERSINRDQALILIRKLAAGFHATGVRPGDCVCIHAFNDIYYPILVLGILAAGAVFTGTNPAYTATELSHHFKTARVGFVITEPDKVFDVVEASKHLDGGMPPVLIFDQPEQPLRRGFLSWRTLLEHGQRDWVSFDDEEQCAATPAAYFFSSGTTGLPKAAVISHRNLIAQHILVTESHKVPYEVSRLLYLPMFHAATAPMSHVSPLRRCITSYVLRRFEVEVFLGTIGKFQITDLTLVPPVAVTIIKHPHVQKYSLQSLRVVIVGAAPLGRDNQMALQRILGDEARVTQVWGMTEATCIATTFRYPESDDTGSVGRMLPNLDAKLIDEDGKEILGLDKVGEMCIRGPTVISRYLDNPTATAASFDSQGYYKTGDVMYCSSAGGKWYVVDRKKELIKVRAFQVAPAEIEGVLLSHSSISDAAVIGVPSIVDADVEHPRAYVVRSPAGATLTENEVIDYCKERLAKYKELTGGVRFLDVLPRNATGKVLKRELKAMVEAENKSQRAKL